MQTPANLFFESLESRRFLSAGPANGVYPCTETWTRDGQTETTPATITIADGSKGQKDVTVQYEVGDPQTGRVVIVRRPSFAASFVQTSDGFQASFINTTIIVSGKDISFGGTSFDRNARPVQFQFKGAMSSSATPQSASAETIRQTESLSKNPVIGSFKGHITRASDGAVIKTKVTTYINSKGHVGIYVLLNESGDGTTEIYSTIHPTHTGSFTLALGAETLDGTLSGHITHTGKLVIHLIVPLVCNSIGTQRRL